MGWFSSDPKPRPYRKGGFVIKCELKKPNDQRKTCGQEIVGRSADAVKDMWKAHKKEHETARRDHIRKMKAKYGDRVGEIMADYESIDKVPKSKFSGLHTKGIPNVPDGQNVNGLVYDNDGKRVPYEVLQRYVKGWD